jgi:hypothetical protein
MSGKDMNTIRRLLDKVYLQFREAFGTDLDGAMFDAWIEEQDFKRKLDFITNRFGDFSDEDFITLVRVIEEEGVKPNVSQ